MIPLILQAFWLVLCYNTLTMSQEVTDYPNVYQKVHNTGSIQKVRSIINEHPDLIYQYKVKDEWWKLCAYTYMQTKDNLKQVDKVLIHKQ